MLYTFQSLESEQSLLGAMLLERDAILSALAIVEAQDFYCEPHRLIFSAIKLLHERGEPADVVTVSEELRRESNLEAAGGIPYIGVLIETCPSSAGAEDYARRVREDGVLRRMLS